MNEILWHGQAEDASTNAMLALGHLAPGAALSAVAAGGAFRHSLVAGLFANRVIMRGISTISHVIALAHLPSHENVRDLLRGVLLIHGVHRFFFLLVEMCGTPTGFLFLAPVETLILLVACSPSQTEGPHPDGVFDAGVQRNEGGAFPSETGELESAVGEQVPECAVPASREGEGLSFSVEVDDDFSGLGLPWGPVLPSDQGRWGEPAISVDGGTADPKPDEAMEVGVAEFSSRSDLWNKSFGRGLSDLVLKVIHSVSKVPDDAGIDPLLLVFEGGVEALVFPKFGILESLELGEEALVQTPPSFLILASPQTQVANSKGVFKLSFVLLGVKDWRGGWGGARKGGEGELALAFFGHDPVDRFQRRHSRVVVERFVLKKRNFRQGGVTGFLFQFRSLPAVNVETLASIVFKRKACRVFESSFEKTLPSSVLRVSELLKPDPRPLKGVGVVHASGHEIAFDDLQKVIVAMI